MINKITIETRVGCQVILPLLQSIWKKSIILFATDIKLSYVCFMKPIKIKVFQNLHPRILSGANGTVAGVHALAKSLERSMKK